jgi:multimeric flavodoxin WrbA
MKILGIISSPKQDGNTAVLVREVLRGAREHGADTEEIFLPEYQLEFCQDCMTCMAQGKCALPDDLESLKQKIAASDGIILGSPTHGLAPNAIMKNFLDRIGMFSLYTGAWAGKYVVGIATAGGIGAKRVARHLTRFTDSVFGRGYVSGTFGVLRGWKRIEQYPEHLQRAYHLGQKLTEDIRQKRTYPFQNLFGRLLGRLVLRRIFLNNIMQHKDAGMKAVYETLVARNQIQARP